MASANNVAKYFLMLADSGAEDAGESMTHLKLQKLLYYAQGFHLAIYGNPLFGENIEAWDHGPVVNALWNSYRDYGSRAIPPAPDFDPDEVLSDDERDLLNDVWNAYGQFSAWKLREMTHREPPWRENYQRGQNAIIPRANLQAYFETQIDR